MGGIALIAAGALFYAVVSKRLEGSIITLPIVFVGFGWVIGDGGTGVVHLDIGHGFIHAIAEVTLVLVLFADASRINLRRLLTDHDLPQRMLLLGLPMIVALGAVVAWALFPAMGWATAFLLAAILAPTDAALGQSVVSNARVPVRIRQALNVESGLNDGIVLPLVLIFAIWAQAPTGVGADPAALVTFAVLQVTLGPAMGAIVGAIGAFAINWASGRGWMTQPFEGVAILSIAALAFTCAEMIGGNGFIAAFVGGLVFGNKIGEACDFLLEFMETEGQLLTLVTFLVFGAAMAPAAMEAFSWTAFLYAGLSLSVVRMVPITLSLTGTGLSMGSKQFLGWFGPRGLASILFALLILEQHPVPAGEAILACVGLTVLLSVVLHGVTAAPLASVYSGMVERRGECEEAKPTSEMPPRHKMS
jgi:NhaP-type Na+/H+ or K+/H+ antiporter